MKLFSILASGFWLLPLLLPAIAEARGPDKWAGTSGAEFLKIYPGARYEGQGGAGVADAEDVDALYWNPAGLADAKKRKTALTYNNYFAAIRLNYLTYVHPTERSGVYGVSFYQLGSGDVARTEVDAAGDPVTGLGSFTTSDMALGLSYGRRFNHIASCGITGKYIYSKIDSVKGTAWALDAGLRFRLAESFYIGAAVQNFGTEIKYQRQKDDLPLNYKMGLAYHSPPLLAGVQLRLGADVNFPKDDRIYFNLGSEIWLTNHMALRVGYDRRNRGVDDGITAGFGVRVKSFGLDYAYTPYGTLKNSNRIGIGYEF